MYHYLKIAGMIIGGIILIIALLKITTNFFIKDIDTKEKIWKDFYQGKNKL